jgi:hypothetical protein
VGAMLTVRFVERVGVAAAYPSSSNSGAETSKGQARGSCVLLAGSKNHISLPLCRDRGPEYQNNAKPKQVKAAGAWRGRRKENSAGCLCKYGTTGPLVLPACLREGRGNTIPWEPRTSSRMQEPEKADVHQGAGGEKRKRKKKEEEKITRA